MRKIAILQRFLPSRSRGGVGHFTHGLANALVARGHVVTVFSEDPAPDGARYRMASVPAPFGRVSPLTFPWALRRCDFRGFDVVHAQGDEQWVRRRGGPPVVRTIHGTALAEAWFNGVRAGSLKRTALHAWFYLMELIADLRADAVIGVSADTGRFYPRFHGTIPNGVDLERFRRAAARAAKSDVPSVVFVGELDSRKRGHRLVEVFRREIRSRVPDAELWLVSPDRPRGGETGGVRHLGPLDDETLAMVIAHAWVLALPSAYEGFGRPYAEAMAAGTVAAATPNPGARDVLDDGRAGVLADDAAFGPAVAALLGDATARAAFHTIGRERVARFDWSRVAEAYEAVYERVIQARGGRAA